MRVLGGLIVSILLLASGPAAAEPSAVLAAESPTYAHIPNDPLGGVYFVTQQYRDLLGREPDAAGLDFWAGRLEQGLAPSSLVGAFVDSPEFARSRLPVARLYLAALGRMPDEDGWAYWSGLLAAGTPLAGLAESFVSTPEGQSRLGGHDPNRLIEALYRNVLNRDPDPGGAAHWRSRLDNGTSRSQLVVEFSESIEFRRRVDPTIRASLLYSGILGREPEEAGLAYWDGLLRQGVPFESVVGGFVGSPEYRSRLTGLWCHIVGKSDVDIFDGPDRNGDSTPWYDAAYARTEENGQAIGEMVENGQFDELRFLAFDWWPNRQLLVALHVDAVESGCLTFLARAPYPDQVTFVRAPYLNTELDAAWLDISSRVGGAWYGSGARYRLKLQLAGPALPQADGILADYGPMIEELTVGAFPYPMPVPVPDDVCIADPGAVDPSDLGLAVSIDLDQTTTPAGGTLSGTFTVTNVGADTYTVAWGYEVTGYVGSGAASSSVFLGSRKLPLNVGMISPGESTSGRLDIATESCDPSAGYRLVAGNYPVWGTISVWNGDDATLPSGPPDHHIWLPAETITLTD